jgi:uncharacterized protein (DUF1330 family)
VNRSLLGFLLFLTALIAGFLLVGWWVGPAMVSLALDEERRSTPYYLIHMLGEEAPQSYFQQFVTLLREEEAQLLWRGGLRALHKGRSRDEVADVAFIEFSEGGGVVQMMTSSSYRDLTESAVPILLGTEVAPGPIARDETLILWLLQLADGADKQSIEQLTAAAARYDGQLVWSVAVDGLEGGRPWNHILLLAFPNAASVEDWLADPQTATDRALARRFFVDDAMLELTSD